MPLFPRAVVMGLRLCVIGFDLGEPDEKYVLFTAFD
jgi:hypothetical protein